MKRINKIKNFSESRLFLITMSDDLDGSIQGNAIIGVANGMWGILAMRTIKGYRNNFLQIIEENVPWYLSELNIE